MITQPGRVYEHVKTGGKYVVMTIAKMQTSDWVIYAGRGEFPSVDLKDVVVYVSLRDQRWWVRPQSEFEDGRFVPA